MAETYPGAPAWLIPILNPLRTKAMKLRQVCTFPLEPAGMSAQQFLSEFERVQEEQRRSTNEWCLQYISTGRWPQVPTALAYWVVARLEFALEQLAVLRRLPGFEHWPPIPREAILEWLLIRAWTSAGVHSQRRSVLAWLSLAQRFRVPGDAPLRLCSCLCR